MAYHESHLMELDLPIQLTARSPIKVRPAEEFETHRFKELLKCPIPEETGVTITHSNLIRFGNQTTRFSGALLMAKA